MPVPTEISHAPELRPGTSGEWVEYLQRLLITADTNANRWPVSVDGDFGTSTERAVRAFQAWVPLPVTGIVDDDTWEAVYRNAHSMEQIAETVGQIAGDEQAGDRDGGITGMGKLEPGHEIKRRGWRCVNVTFVIKDFTGELYEGGQLYARFEASDGAQSDEYASVHSGSATFREVWVPDDGGRIWLYLNGGGWELEGGKPFDTRDAILEFELQQEFDTRNLTVSEATQHGWMTSTSIGAKVSSGFDFKVVKVGSEIASTDTSGESGGQTYGETEQVVVRVATRRLAIAQVG